MYGNVRLEITGACVDVGCSNVVYMESNNIKTPVFSCFRQNNTIWEYEKKEIGPLYK